MTHHDAQAVEADRVECVLVGDVVADVDRQYGLGDAVARGDVVEHPMQRLTLVPGHVRPKFDDFAASRHPQTFGPPESAHRRNHVIDVFRIDIAVVHSNGKALVLQHVPGILLRSSANRVAACAKVATAVLAAAFW